MSSRCCRVIDERAGREGVGPSGLVLETGLVPDPGLWSAAIVAAKLVAAVGFEPTTSGL